MCPQRRQTRQRGSGASEAVTDELARDRAIEAKGAVGSVDAVSLIVSVRVEQPTDPNAA